ncbi:MAG: phospholipase D-like domain-containing protein, partial [Haloferacaceae archaeon]
TTPPAANETTTPTTPHVVSVLPNPVADGDSGEFVVVAFPSPGTASLTDGEATVTVTAPRPGRVVVTPDPSAVRNLTAASGTVAVVRAPGSFRLSNAGETLRLLRDGAELDRVAYESAPEGERLVRSGRGRRWWPVGFAPRDPVRFGAANATAFVLPDDPGVALDALRGADERLLVAGYTFTSRRVASLLIRTADRGVRVRVLVDGGPVGGLSRREARVLDRLVAAGADVRVVGGPRAAFSFHHAKYAVADGRAVVLTENWKPAGVGGNASRGWGVVAESAPVADELAGLFAADADRTGTVGWRRYRSGRRLVPTPAANGSYPSNFAPREYRVESVSLLTAPGNAEGALVDRIDAADDRVAVLQPTLGGPDQALVRAVVRAARRGVEVRVLLSGAWYVREENRALASRLDALARRESLPLSVRVADPGGRFEKIHAKGLLVDDAVAVGSLNWNDHSAGENREVVVVLEGESVAAYYRRVFDADWRGGGQRVPMSLVAVAALAAVAAAALARRGIHFERRAGDVRGAESDGGAESDEREPTGEPDAQVPRE